MMLDLHNLVRQGSSLRWPACSRHFLTYSRMSPGAAIAGNTKPLPARPRWHHSFTRQKTLPRVGSS